MLKGLKEEVWKANMDLPKYGLITFTWGNVSGIDREKGIIVIKPSGVPYSELKPEHMVALDLEGNKVEGDLKPSSDTPTHLVLYNKFSEIGGVIHTHSSCLGNQFCPSRERDYGSGHHSWGLFLR